jgi:uncharacterized protein (DUF433 family)
MNPIEYAFMKLAELFGYSQIELEDELTEEYHLLSEDDILELILTVVHNANAVMKKINGEKHEELADMEPARRAGIKAAIKYALENDTTPEQSHINWLAAQEALGYKYGVEIDRVNLLHPCMVPYEQLPAAQKLKDDMFMSIINSFKEKIPR